MNEQEVHNAKLSLEEILKKWWGYDKFRPLQRDIIEEVLAGRDILALMPTGGGKSLTYQVPAMAVEGLTIVVTPLIALMKDQVDKLRSRGISAVAVHSGMDKRKIEAALDNATYGDVKLLYISPERLATEAFCMRLRRMKVSIIAVDEAHCISQWGYDFRPSYLRIAEMREIVPAATVIALTASATERVASDIMVRLGFKTENIIRSSFARPNLSYVVRRGDKERQLRRILNNVEGSGIIYAQNRELCERITVALRADGESVEFYHAGLPALERSIRQEEWLDGKVRVIVATSAFGMGIDKDDVRFVVHYKVPHSLESYYQEAGRAGRDGKRSYAVLLVDDKDTDNLFVLHNATYPPISDIKLTYERVCNYLQVAIGEGAGVSFPFDLYDYCYKTRTSSTVVLNALKILEQNGLITLLDEHDNYARIMITCSRDALYGYDLGEGVDGLLAILMRLYPGIFTEFKYVRELDIAGHSGMPISRVYEYLKRLWRSHVIRYIPSTCSPLILFNSERLPSSDVYISPDSYHHRRAIAYERVLCMDGYVKNDTVCRSRMIEEYFGVSEGKDCGVCDVCLAKRRMRAGEDGMAGAVISLLGNNPMSPRELADAITGNVDMLSESITKLIDEGKICIDKGGKLKINS